jgi:hypothetical protein
MLFRMIQRYTDISLKLLLECQAIANEYTELSNLFYNASCHLLAFNNFNRNKEWQKRAAGPD